MNLENSVKYQIYTHRLICFAEWSADRFNRSENGKNNKNLANLIAIRMPLAFPFLNCLNCNESSLHLISKPICNALCCAEAECHSTTIHDEVQVHVLRRAIQPDRQCALQFMMFIHSFIRPMCLGSFEFDSTIVMQIWLAGKRITRFTKNGSEWITVGALMKPRAQRMNGRNGF